MARIVIQESDPAVLEILELALSDAGFDVLAINHFAHDFLELIVRNQPHLIVLDYKISGKDAIQICSLLKQNFPLLPIIAISCNDSINKDYLIYGFDDYIRKPFDLKILIKILRKHIPEFN